MTRDEALNAIQSQKAGEYSAGMKALQEHGLLKDLPKVTPFTKSPNESVRKKAQDTACALIRKNLVQHFHELVPEVRQKLATLMGSLDPAIVDRISKDVYSSDETVRVRAVQILGLLHHNPRVKDILTKLLQNKDQRIRATAVNIIGKIAKQNDLQLVFAVLNDEDPRVRANTLESLENVGGSRIIPVFMRFRNDPNNRIRGNALKALHTAGNVDIRRDLEKMVESNSNYMKASALWVMSQTGVYTPLLEEKAGYLLMSENEMVVNNARKALRAIRTPKANAFLNYIDESEPA